MISLCMIVRNEEALLPRALANWRELADMLIVVDTGSDDDTIAVAMAHGAAVHIYDWQYPGDKGHARNAAIDAAPPGWIVMLDADEVIRHPAALRKFLLEEAANIDGINVEFHNIDETNTPTMIWQQMRVFRRGLYRYRHREHELPLPTDDAPRREGTLSVVFEHRPPGDRAPGKNQPMLDRLTLDVEEHPGDPHPVYFLHRQYALVGMWDEAIEWGQRYLQIAGSNDRCECYGNLAHCHLQRGETIEAVRYLHQAAAEQPARRIWWIRLAEIYYDHHNFDVAMALLRCAAELPQRPEQHYQPVANERYLYELLQRCQIAQRTGEHYHKE